MPKPSTIADNRRTATLRDWWFVQSGNHTAIQGRVYHDRKGRFKDGDTITTSKILRLDFENCMAITRKSTYILGIKRHDSPFVDTAPGGLE
jgi:hypothetical protein